MSSKDLPRTIVLVISVINVIYTLVESNTESLCENTVCTLKPGEHCIDNKTCEVLYCSTMWYSWAQITRHKCLNISEYYYEQFYLECKEKECPVGGSTVYRLSTRIVSFSRSTYGPT